MSWWWSTWGNVIISALSGNFMVHITDLKYNVNRLSFLFIQGTYFLAFAGVKQCSGHSIKLFDKFTQTATKKSVLLNTYSDIH